MDRVLGGEITKVRGGGEINVNVGGGRERSRAGMKSILATTSIMRSAQMEYAESGPGSHLWQSQNA